MFKKLFQIAVTLATLIGAHLGYTRGFALVAERLAISGEDINESIPEIAASRSTLRGIELAREHLGADHWAAQHGLPINYFDPERGFYMYTQSYKRLKNGQRLELRPFAVITVSKDGKSHKVITSDEAIVDFNKPYMSMKGNGGATRIVHAQMAGNVVIRDDKGTDDGRQDDLIVGPLTHLDYDEKESHITSDSDVILRDRDLTATGKGLLIRLRRGAGGGSPGGASSGFEAEAAYLLKDVHLVVKNVGSTGILPGKSRDEGTGQTPLDLKCDREMEILLPPSRPSVAIGPPHLNRPPDPTFVKFHVKVVVLRGTHTPDQLNCDELLLTLMPTPKPAPSAAKPPTDAAVADASQDGPADASQHGADPGASGGKPEEPKAPAPSGPLTELKLREALATGHAVWIQSASQGLTARCIELKYKKFTDGVTPDETYLNGGASKKLYVQKIENYTTGPKVGTIKSVLRIFAMDATIFDDGQGGASTVVARGPGKAEERPSLNASIERTAWWEDQMILRTEAGPVAPGSALTTADGKPAKGTLRRELTLTGVSKLVDHVRETTLDARTKIIARFKSAPKATPGASDGSPKIESLDALDDVHLTAPNRTMTARHQFNAVFEDDAPGGLVVQAPAGTAPAVASAAPSPLPGPAIPVATNPALASAKVAKPDATDAPADGEAPKKPAPAPAPVEPAVDVRANRVWAKILHRGGEGKDEFREARLRGDVMVHQDPAPGKQRGTDASGEALDLMSQGDGLMKFRVLDADPAAVATKARLAASGRPPVPPILARVETEEMTIEGHDIGLDQKANYAEVPGPGKLMEWAERGLLDDKGLDAPRPRPAVVGMPGGPTKARLVITWNEEMKFHGKTTDPQGRPSAKAEFRGKSAVVHTPDGKSVFRNGVTATMENALILCEAMDVFTDKPVAMNRDPRSKEKKDPTVPPEPAAQIAFMDCRGRDRLIDDQPVPGVDVISQKVYPGTRDVRERQRIWGDHVTYDKRTGDFTAPSQGLVYLYKRKGVAKDKKPAAIQTAGPGRNGMGGVAPPDREALAPMELTKVAYSEGMQGRFGVNKDKADVEDKIAEFYGNVQAINAVVKTPNSDLDFDRPPDDVMFLTSEYLRVVSHPLGEGKSAQQLLYAKDNAQARTIDRTIQGDRITYDSATENAYVYGDIGKEVVLIDQKNPGQPSSTLRGKSGRYNRRTREASIEDPQTINFADLKSGIRPKPGSPDAGGSPRALDPMKQQRVPYTKIQRMNVERGSNSGR